MPETLRARARDDVEAIGAVGDLADIFDRVRVTVAPLAYGAGIKGKVLDSLAAGIPCVCTPIAAEGLDSAGDPHGPDRHRPPAASPQTSGGCMRMPP